MQVSLSPDLEQLVREKVESGQYITASEVVSAGLRLLFEREELQRLRKEALVREIQLGVDALERGEFATYDDASLKDLAEDVKREGRRRRGVLTHPEAP